MPSMETSVALLVCQVSDADCPACMVFGLTEIEAVGAGGGGGGGGGGGVAFFLQAPSMIMALKASIKKNHFRLSFTFNPPGIPNEVRNQTKYGYVLPGLFMSDSLFPTPIRLRITTGKRQLLNFCSIRQHRPDLQAAGAIRLEHDVPAIRRPRREIVPTAVMGQLHPLLTGDVHQIDI